MNKGFQQSFVQSKSFQMVNGKVIDDTEQKLFQNTADGESQFELAYNHKDQNPQNNKKFELKGKSAKNSRKWKVARVEKLLTAKQLSDYVKNLKKPTKTRKTVAKLRQNRRKKKD